MSKLKKYQLELEVLLFGLQNYHIVTTQMRVQTLELISTLKWFLPKQVCSFVFSVFFLFYSFFFIFFFHCFSFFLFFSSSFVIIQMRVQILELTSTLKWYHLKRVCLFFSSFFSFFIFVFSPFSHCFFLFIPFFSFSFLFLSIRFLFLSLLILFLFFVFYFVILFSKKVKKMLIQEELLLKKFLKNKIWKLKMKLKKRF